jgi:hypothetical protein
VASFLARELAEKGDQEGEDGWRRRGRKEEARVCTLQAREIKKGRRVTLPAWALAI